MKTLNTSEWRRSIASGVLLKTRKFITVVALGMAVTLLASCFSTIISETNFYFKSASFNGDEDFLKKTEEKLSGILEMCHSERFQGVLLDCYRQGAGVWVLFRKINGQYAIQISTSWSAWGFSPSVPEVHYLVAKEVQDLISGFGIEHIDRVIQGVTTKIGDADIRVPER